MKPTKTFYVHDFELLETDFDVDGNLRSARLMQFLQNAAGQHVKDFGLGWDDLNDKQLLWVLSKMKYRRVKSITKAVKTLRVYTWPKAPNKFFYDRLFEVYDANTDKLLVEAYSQWLVVDKASRKAVTANTVDGFADADFADETIALAPDFARVRKTDDFVEVDSVVVRRSMLDINKHVNNTNYITFVEDALDEGSHNYVEIVYHKEVLCGQTVDMYVKRGADVQVVGMVGDVMCFTVVAEK